MERSERKCVVCGFSSGNFVIRMRYVSGALQKWFYHAPETSQGCFAVYERDIEGESLF